MHSLKNYILLIFTFALSSCLQAQTNHYLHFDNIDDFAELPDASQYFTGASGISMTGWFCSDGNEYGNGYFGFRGAGTGSGEMYVIELNNGLLECRYISTGGFNEYVSPNGTVQALEWQHLAWVYDGTSSSLYMNGVFIGSTPSSGSFTSTDRSFGIGKSIVTPFNFVFGGRIDEVSVWSKGLTQADIQDMMANELTGTEPNLELYYKMNQGIPAGDNTAITQLISEVGAGTRDADLVNFALNGATSNFNISEFDPGFTVSDYCAGSVNQATITGLAGGTFTFNNPPGDGATIDPATGSITDGIAGTSYDIRYTTPGDCAPHEIHSLTVLAADDATFTLNDHCTNPAIAPTDIATPGGTFSLNPAPLDGATIDAMTGAINDGVTGSSYTVEYTTPEPCSASYNQTVTLLGTPEYNNLVQECAIDNLTYTVSFDIMGGDPSTYAISGDGTLTGNSFTSDPIPSSTSYLFGISDINQCGVVELEGYVTCACDAYATFEEGISICEGSNGQLEINLEGESPWSVSYSIDGIPQTIIETSVDSYMLDVTEAGIYQLNSVTDFNCSSDLSDTEPVAVIAMPLPTASIAGDEFFCSGEMASITIELTGSPNYNLGYTIDGGAPMTLDISESSTYELLTGQIGSYTLISLSDANCIGNPTGTIIVTEEPLPTATLTTGEFTICEGSNQELQVNLTGSPDWEVSYSIDGVLQTPINASTSPLMIDATANGTYELQYISDLYCDNGGTEEEVSLSYYPPITITQTSDVSVCIGESAEVGASASGGLGPDYSYTWQAEDQVSSFENTATYLLAESGTVSVMVNDGCNYNQTFEIPITIHQLPPISIGGDTQLCGAGEALFTNETPEQYVSDDCTWTIDGESIASCGNVIESFELGSYDIGLSMTSPAGCYNELSITGYLNVVPAAEADFFFNPTEATTTDSKVWFTNLSSDADQYIWSFGNGEFSQEFEPVYDFGAATGVYTICLTADNFFGCADSVCQLIRVKNDLLVMVPNSFTPDDDGINDYFYPVLNGVDKNDYLFSIFDRGGKLVFETRNVTDRWNGSYMEELDYYAADAWYTWKLVVKALGSVDKQEFIGSVLMIR